MPPQDGTMVQEAAAPLADLICSSTQLQHLDLSGNNMQGPLPDCLQDAIANSSSLFSLRLGRNPLGVEGYESVCSILQQNTRLRKLDLSSSATDGKSIRSIAKFLQSECNLISLKLSNNRIGLGACEHFREMLISNASIRRLDLESCYLDEVGAQYILQALEFNSTLRHLNIRIRSGFEQSTQKYLAHVLPLNCSLRSIEIPKRAFQLDGHGELLMHAIECNAFLRSVLFVHHEVPPPLERRIERALDADIRARARRQRAITGWAPRYHKLFTRKARKIVETLLLLHSCKNARDGLRKNRAFRREKRRRLSERMGIAGPASGAAGGAFVIEIACVNQEGAVERMKRSADAWESPRLTGNARVREAISAAESDDAVLVECDLSALPSELLFYIIAKALVE
eukprot:TRINITY_DN2421_c0_g1_i1.p1 TRINITY_DN2421_c0_g1~~TRINITY_DN2421_c0_g1_i1.p1  ORF type:complete len:399 (+),score=35.56 TRINITY_DN2421_c0_g1_i1:460-1656(+)